MPLQPELNEKARRQVSSMYLNLRKSQRRLDDLEPIKGVLLLKVLDNKLQ
jgi:DNA replicative helicase MCM subunit Mcm2 (Cdc46/Mcm family)